ncbi:MAG: hypothetical protein DWQ01_18260 [Planctomycetota bacterium]|nr:MAG: hypothetical protein DWQ01_18260 [Planctomycetota bacterium]
MGLASGAVSQQIPLDTRYEIQRPVASDKKADHATVAMNDDGDILVTWVAEEDTPNPGKKIEAAFFSRASAGNLWDIHPSFEISHAASVVPLSSKREKPDVVSLGQDFLVAWTRERSGFDVLECAIVRPPSVTMTAHPVVVFDANGMPFQLDGSLNMKRNAGVVDLACRPDGVGAASYVSFKSVTTVNEGDEISLYLRGVVFQWDKLNGVLSVATTPMILDTFRFDEAIAWPITETDFGRGLPDCVFNGDGELVVSHEEFEIVDNADDASRIQLQWFDVGIGGTLTETRSQAFSDRGIQDSPNPQRRPNLVASEDDSSLLALTWGNALHPEEQFVALHWPAGGNLDYHHLQLTPSSLQNKFYYSSPALFDGTFPGSYQARVVSSRRDGPGMVATLGRFEIDSGVPTGPVDDPQFSNLNFWRPALAVKRLGTEFFHALTVEGKIQNPNNLQRIHLVISDT